MTHHAGPPPLTPREIKERLDDYVVGQDKAKRAVAVALRNRWRRRQLDKDLAADVYPKNILLIGPTGVGKTEIARRLAALAGAPFIKVEASKYSEVGYHGRDVESMVRDLADAAVALVRAEKLAEVQAEATRLAEERILQSMAEERGIEATPYDHVGGAGGILSEDIWRPTPEAMEGSVPDLEHPPAPAVEPVDEEAEKEAAREVLRRQIAAGDVDDAPVEMEVIDRNPPTLSIMGPQGNETMGIDTQALQEMWGRQQGPRTKIRRLSVKEAREAIVDEEADKLLDQDAIVAEALQRAESDGIIFLDEIDKVIGSGGGDGPDVSREGVQRDLLPVVEGCAVYTRYGHVRTDHVLFVAAGAFHFHKPSELIPELQGRFPVRVALQPLREEDFVRILTEPRNSLVRQYEALFHAEDVQLTFTRDGIERLAGLAFRANATTQDIGARRLMTILERCLEDLSFDAAEMAGQEVVVDADRVHSILGDIADDADLIRYEI